MRKSSLLRYVGGKSRAISHLKCFIPPNTKELCSPFFGGGSFELSLASEGVKVYGYDIFEPVVCFWDSVLNNREKLVEKVLAYYPLQKDMFKELQKRLPFIKNNLEMGAVFYVLNRCSFSGTVLNGGMSPNHPRFGLNEINKIKNFNIQFNIEMSSFEESIKKHNCLIYADPPYLTEQKLYGVRGNLHKKFKHKLLAEMLNDRGNFILSYNNCEPVKDMYREHFFYYPNWKYGIGKSKKSNEILIISKDLKKNTIYTYEK